MHSDPTELLANHLALSGVNARANVNSELPDRRYNRPAAAHRPRRTIKRREESVPGRINFAASMPSQLIANHGVMLSEQVFPSSITKFHKPLCCLDDVGEQYGGEHAVRLDFNFPALAG